MTPLREGPQATGSVALKWALRVVVGVLIVASVVVGVIGWCAVGRFWIHGGPHRQATPTPSTAWDRRPLP